MPMKKKTVQLTTPFTCDIVTTSHWFHLNCGVSGLFIMFHSRISCHQPTILWQNSKIFWQSENGYGHDTHNFDSMHCTKNEVSIQNFFSKCDQISSFLRIWSHLLKKYFMENCIFCAVIAYSTLGTLCCDVVLIVLVYDCLFWAPKYYIWQLTNYLFQWD